MTKYSRLLLMALGLLVLTPALWAQQAADLAPGDAGVFIQIDDLAKHRAELAQDPIYQTLRPHLPDFQQNEVWRNLQTALGMSGAEVFDHYFGQSVALVGSRVGDGRPAVLFSRISKVDGQLAVERLQLQPAEKIGEFALYTTPDGNATLGFSDQWMAVCNAESRDYATDVLKQIGSGRSLANDPDFKTWTGKLPEQRTTTVFLRVPAPEAADGQALGRAPMTLHALSVTRTGKNLSVHYAGQAGSMLAKLGAPAGPHGTDFGPLPAGACAGLAINFFNRNPMDVERLKALLPAKDLGRDVLSKLSGPIVLGVAARGPIAPTGPADLGAAPPSILYLGVRMSDPSVAADFEGMMNTLVVLANLRGQERQAPLIKIAPAHHNGMDYHTANLGDSIAARSGRPEMAAVKLCFGRLRDWYVVATDQGFFNQCVDACALPSSGPGRFIHPAGGNSDIAGTIATLWVDGPALARQLEIMAPKMQQRHTRRASVMETIAAMLGDSKSVALRVWQSGDEEVDGQLDLIRN